MVQNISEMNSLLQAETPISHEGFCSFVDIQKYGNREKDIFHKSKPAQNKN